MQGGAVSSADAYDATWMAPFLGPPFGFLEGSTLNDGSNTWTPGSLLSTPPLGSSMLRNASVPSPRRFVRLDIAGIRSSHVVSRLHGFMSALFGTGAAHAFRNIVRLR